MTKKRGRLKKYIPLLLVCVLVLTLGLSLLGWDTLGMSRRYALATTARAEFGADGQMVLVDQGKTAIELLDSAQVLQKRYTGETLKGFYHAEQTALAADGALYIADLAIRETGGEVETLERVLENRNGNYRTVWETVLEDGGVSSEQGAAILELQFFDGAVWFLRAEDYGLGLYRAYPGGEAALVRRAFCGDRVNDASVDLTTGVIAIATRRGYVRVEREEEHLWKTVPSEAEHLMPQSISARNGAVWFSDAFDNRVCRFQADRPEDGFETVQRGENGFLDLNASPDGSEILACDGAGFARIGSAGLSYTGEVLFAGFFLTVLLRVCFGAAVLSALLLIPLLLRRLLWIFRTESALRVVLVVLAAASVSGFVAFSLMSDLFAQEDDTLAENMKLFAESMLQSIDAEDLRELDWEQDYGGSAFLRVRRPLDNLLALAHAEENPYTYALYRLDGETVRLIMDSDDSAICGQPYKMAGQEYIAAAQRTGHAYALQTQNAEGNRTVVVVPVTDESGAPYAVMELGLDLSLRNHARTEALVNMILNVICATAVVVMLIMEIIFLISFAEKKRGALQKTALVSDGPTLVPVRTLMFLIYTADCMQEAFIAVLCAQLYRGGLPLSDSAAAALPISAELLAMAVFSALGGQAVQRWGSRKLLTGGMVLQLAGFLTCLALGSYWGLFLGKVLIGAGMGAVYVTCNTVAAAGTSEESASGAFAGIAAGTISGIAAGAGLSSVFLSIGGWRMVYLVGALFVFAGILLSTAAGDVRPARREERSIDAREISLARFFFNRRVPVFFLLILVPFMMTPSYRVYFFPIYAQENGLSDVRVGQIYLLCGLLVLYLGPKLSNVVLKKLGCFRGLLLASLVAGAGMAVFVLLPAIGSVVAGVLLVYASYGFGSVCQYVYFQELPECLGYGSGRSMGVYSVFENLGGTVGPMVFGALLTMGYRAGIAAFCGGLLLLAAVYAAISWRSGRHYA